jgi:AcrR family transcriptional regulator
MRRERREQILAAAKEVFAERGYHNASINDIIRRAGIARGTFYLYFESKQKIFESILDQALVELRSRITRIETGEGAEPPQTQLRGSLVRVMEFVLGDPHFSRLLLSHSMTGDAEAIAQVDGFYEHTRRLIASSLDYGIEMGLVRPCDPALVAAALLGAVRGIIDHVISTDEPPEIDAIVDELIAFALRGVVDSTRW